MPGTVLYFLYTLFYSIFTTFIWTISRFPEPNPSLLSGRTFNWKSPPGHPLPLFTFFHNGGGGTFGWGIVDKELHLGVQIILFRG